MGLGGGEFLPDETFFFLFKLQVFENYQETFNSIIIILHV